MSSSTTTAPPSGTRSHREVLTAISGLVMGMFVAVIAGTVVSTSMPVIVADLGGDQTAYTWVITGTLLATGVTTPIWGKLADLVNRKVLLQLALGLFVAGTVAAGFAHDTSFLIAMRVVQGLGSGGLMSLVMIAIALIISPRERGKYMGVVGGIMAVATIGGPLLGGVITDLWGWRANFFVSVPFAIIALILIQFTLHLPAPDRSRKVKIDYLGIVFLAVGVSTLLIWVSLGGNQFDWDSATSYTLIATAAVGIVAFVITEFLVSEPIVPMDLFKNRTFALSVVASIGVGIALFTASIYLAQYFQLARGATPTESGLLQIPLIVGQMGISIVVGALISKFGKWKGWMLLGSALLIAGLALMGTLAYDTEYWVVAIYMFLLGAGLGMVMQNLTLIVQNDTPAKHLGAASSNVNFFRTVLGTVGVTAMSTVLTNRVTDGISNGFTGFVPESQAEIDALTSLQSGAVPHVGDLPERIRVVIEGAYGSGIAEIFALAVPFAIVGLIAIAFIKNKPLSKQNAAESLVEQAEETVIEIAEADAGGAPTGSIAALRPNGDGTSTATGSVAVLERTDLERTDLEHTDETERDA